MQAIHHQGIHWQLVRVWNGSKQLERKLKLRKNAYLLCPICNPSRWYKNGESIEEKIVQ